MMKRKTMKLMILCLIVSLLSSCMLISAAADETPTLLDGTQKFVRIVYDAMTAEGKVSDQYLTVGTSGTMVAQNLFTGHVNQQWNFVKVQEPDVYKIVSESTGQCIRGAASSLNNIALGLCDWTGETTQKWRIRKQNDGLYTLVNCSTGLSFASRAGTGTESGTLVQKTSSNTTFSLELTTKYTAYHAGVGEFEWFADDTEAVSLVQQLVRNGYTDKSPTVYSFLQRMKSSTIYALATHGSPYTLELRSNECHVGVASQNINDILAPYNPYNTGISYDFANTRCVVLLSCSTAQLGATYSGNVVNKLHSHGVKTVIGFEEEQGDQMDLYWYKRFLEYSASGYTVQDAASAAAALTHPHFEALWEEYESSYLSTGITEHLFFTWLDATDSFCIVGSDVQKLSYS